jgi:DNA adenine methylase
MTTKILKPLFKWTGGKTKMRGLYGDDFFPERQFNRFIDCFYGGGSITHWILEKYPQTEFVINDQNRELIQMYETLRDHSDVFIEEVQKLEKPYIDITIPFDKNVSYNTTEQYLKRHEYYTKIKLSYINDYIEMGKIKESAYLYFLMKTSFNGWWKTYLYSNGRYSTAPGLLNEKDKVIDVELLKNHSTFFNEQCIILNGDFEDTKKFITSDTYIYFDPPYRDSTTNYTSEGFNDTHQMRLCEYFKYADSMGAMASLSNKEIGDGFFETNLPNFDIKLYDVSYTAGYGTSTSKVKECLVRNFTSTNTPLNELFVFGEN